MLLPRRRILIVVLAGVSVGILFTWNLITTNDVFKSQQSKESPLIFQLAESASSLPTVSVIRVHQAHHPQESVKVPVRETLFRGDIPSKHPPGRPGFPEENKLQYFETNGHQGAGGSGVRGPDVGLAGSLPISPVKIPYKLVHIDLKGAPPKLSYLKSLMGLVSEAGGNGILLEYEDMFPFGGPLTGTPHKAHFSKEEIQDLISTAVAHNLEVIPLVQTFGHLEFVLKLEGFQTLREVLSYPQEICPSNEKAWRLVTSMIDQVLSVRYGRAKKGLPTYIHIGLDEVYHIGECEQCRGKPPKELFLNHVLRVARYVRETYGVRPIIWDDMLRKFYVEELLQSDIGREVELMMWDYTEDVDRLLSPYLWPMYTQVFPNIWVASAYKGAFGETLHKVDIQRHALNQLSWLRVLARESAKIRNLRGVALTGWSRYDHFSVLCELLPVAIPSLILSLQLWVHQDFDKATENLFKFIKCDVRSLDKLDVCQWDGVDLANSLNTLDFYQTQTTALIQSQRNEKGWLTSYNLRHNYTSPWRLSEGIQQGTQYLTSLQGYEASIRATLAKYFPSFVVEEWVEEKVGTIQTQLQSLLTDAESLQGRRVWERRPLATSITTNTSTNRQSQKLST